ncbi:hypothetical protein QFC21_004768 [Naganishia friedmannii]|uniref:Uncharacterized protein n=1 Tax=Naganishia friedmannii TaxID=89922 RepID=A0ACC2VF50_9TREE|nr:hypothetical protein QFC21_004768 [Naganishia friedmannii]
MCSTFIALATGKPIASLTSDISFNDKRSYLEKRVATGTVCSTIPVTVPGNIVTGVITLNAGVCLCTQAGVLTPASLAALTSSVTLSVNLVVATTVYLTTGGVTNAAVTAAQTRLNAITPTCNYPANSVPACSTYTGAVQQTSTTCYFTCATNFYNCGQFCIPLAQNCISGIPSRRDLKNTPNLCPPGLEACYLDNLASLAKGRSVSWECMDTQKDIESCGGCQFPVSGGEQGEDCTTMVGVNSVACVDGACEALSCARGYKLHGKECTLDTTYKSFWLQHV